MDQLTIGQELIPEEIAFPETVKLKRNNLYINYNFTFAVT